MEMERELLLEELLRALELKHARENEVKRMRLMVEELSASIHESQRSMQREKARERTRLDLLCRGLFSASPNIAAAVAASESASSEEKLSLVDTDLTNIRNIRQQADANILEAIAAVDPLDRSRLLAQLQAAQEYSVHSPNMAVAPPSKVAADHSFGLFPPSKVAADHSFGLFLTPADVKQQVQRAHQEKEKVQAAPENRWSVQAAPENRWQATLKPGMTTVVLRNIPARYGIEDLLQEWEPDGSFDFLHLPRQERRSRHLGHAFLNFVSHTHAVDFCRKWHGGVLKFGMSKPLDITAASIQGYEGNLANLRVKKVWRVRDEHLPALFCGEQRLDTRSVLHESQMGILPE